MRLVVIGVNHKTAPVALRERLAFVGDEVTTALEHLTTLTDGCVILSTCNRTELYLLLPDMVADDEVDEGYYDKHGRYIANTSSGLNRPISQVLGQSYGRRIMMWLAEFKGLPLAQIEPYLYSHYDAHALTHWLRVASGLDSMILGEPQILGQIKQAVSLAQAHGGISNQLGWIIDQIFAAAKRVRNETQVGSQAVSLGYAAAKLVTQIFDDPSKRTLLLVAAGEMNRLVANNIAGLGIGKIIICNRSINRAETLAEELIAQGHQVEVALLTQLASLLPQADVVSSCSGSMDTLISIQMTKQALKQRRYQPMLMVDLAVPRDIEPAVSRLDDVYLYSIDDLQHVIAGNIEQRRQAAVDAELLVSQLVVEIEQSFQVKQVGRDIQYYRHQAQNYAQNLLTESLVKLQQGDIPAEHVMAELTRRLTQTLTHAPSKLMRKAAREGDTELLDFVVTGLHNAHRQR